MILTWKFKQTKKCAIDVNSKAELKGLINTLKFNFLAWNQVMTTRHNFFFLNIGTLYLFDNFG